MNERYDHRMASHCFCLFNSSGTFDQIVVVVVVFVYSIRVAHLTAMRDQASNSD